MKRILSYCTGAALLISFVFISPLRSAALDAMSVFRVSQANTIRIAITDIQEIVTNLTNLAHNAGFGMPDEAASVGIIGSADGPTQIIDSHVYNVDKDAHMEMFDKAGIEDLASVDEFTAFDFKLPKAVSETPNLAAKQADKIEHTLDTAKINKALEHANASRLLPESFNGGTVVVDTPPAIVAEYGNFILGATQMPVLSAQDGIDLNVIKDCVLSSSLIPANLVQQLAMIDVYTRDVYLPVITGISREVNINGSTGYVYSASDAGMILNAISLPQLASHEDFGSLTDDFTSANVTAFVWVNDGVIYALVGELPETELLSIARSVK